MSLMSLAMCRLFLLATSRSDKQFSLAMGVSSETIRWHVKNLFRKPNAATRKHLIDRSRMTDLLDSLDSG
jgi:LuxR family maltose regulon positive regulatory protein